MQIRGHAPQNTIIYHKATIDYHLGIHVKINSKTNMIKFNLPCLSFHLVLIVKHEF